MRLTNKILDKKRKIDRWLKMKEYIDVLEKEIEMAEPPIINDNAPDFYGEIGCCLTCNETLKENIEGVKRNIYYNGKFYDCLCLEGKCKKCDWYDSHSKECQRKHFEYI